MTRAAFTKAWGAAVAAMAWLAAPAAGQVSGIAYSLTPVLEHVRFDKDAALDDAFLYGGRLGFSFGEFIELNGIYLLHSSAKTDFASYSASDPAVNALLAGLPERKLRLTRYGGQTKFNIGRGALFPFVTLGAGAVLLEPDGLNRSDTVYLSAGIGFQYSLRDRYTLVVAGNSLHYQYNPAATLLSPEDLSSLGLVPEDFDLVRVSNFSASAGLQIYLGGRSPGELTPVDRALQEQFGQGWRGLGLRVEPLAGKVNFSGPLGYRPDQRLVGASLGVDLGRYTALRGFYWRGVKEGSWTDFDQLDAFGGEMKLAFADAVGLTPFVTVGGGYMNVRGGYEGNGEAEPQDRPFALGGVGLILPMGNSLSFVGSARALLMSSSGVDNVSDPGQVHSNTMFSAALSFGLGAGKGRTDHDLFGREVEEERYRRLQENLDRAQGRVDSLAAAVAMQQRGAPPVAETVPTAEAPAAAKAPATPEVATNPGRWISVPLPEEGEFYLRFGKPGAVSVETVGGDPLTYSLDPATGALMPTPQSAGTPRAAGSGTAAASPQATLPPGATPEQVQALIRQELETERQQSLAAGQASADSVYNRIERLLEQRFRDMDARLESVRDETLRQAALNAAATTPPPAVTVAEPAGEAAPISEASPTPEPVRISEPGDFEGARFILGYNLNSPNQWLLGARGEYRPGGRSFVVAPDVVFGFGDGDRTTSVNLNAFRRLRFGRFESTVPYAGLGVGVQHRESTKGVFNVLVGAERSIRGGLVSLEYVTQNFFDNNRLFLGYRLGL